MFVLNGRARQRAPAHPGESNTRMRYHGLDLSGCPCCRVADEAEQRYLRWFLGEYYYSLPMLLRLRRDRFCVRHAAQLMTADTGRLSGTFQFLAEAERALLRTFRHDLTREKRAVFGPYIRRRVPEHIAASDGTDGCPACDAGATAVTVDVSRLLVFLATDEGRETYRAHASGLCRPHLWPALHDAPTETADWLAAETERRLDVVCADLDLYFHRLDYRFHHEPHGDEQTAWRRALLFFWREVDPG